LQEVADALTADAFAPDALDPAERSHVENLIGALGERSR
jgi:hypothetical protein